MISKILSNQHLGQERLSRASWLLNVGEISSFEASKSQSCIVFVNVMTGTFRKDLRNLTWRLQKGCPPTCTMSFINIFAIVGLAFLYVSLVS